MVYYGVVSKGCQRCRQRKIKCDQRKPGCLRCQKSGHLCPGYRDLDQVIFRDESERILRQVRRSEGSSAEGRLAIISTSSEQNRSTLCSTSEFPASSHFWPAIFSPILPAAPDLGAHFFFLKYTSDEPPFPTDRAWLAESYHASCGGQAAALRASIEAVGMAALSNVCHSPRVEDQSKRQYHQALAATNHALSDPVQAVADTTLMAVILLGLFECVNLETWDRHRSWAAHVQGATALLERRGREQFTRERGAQLFLQLRSQILLACAEQHAPIPPALVRATYDFEASPIRPRWRRRDVASPGSMSEISFRLVNLCARWETGEIPDPAVVRDVAREIDDDLEAWRQGVAPGWRYSVNADDGTTAVAATADGSSGGTTGFDGKRHVYPNLWVAEAWNSWRTLRIRVNQIIHQTDHRHRDRARADIRRLSTDLCISTSNFTGTPRILSLIRPLYIISREPLNPAATRAFAVAQLRRIDATMGIRQAGLLAATAAEGLDASPSRCLVDSESAPSRSG